MQQDSRGPLGSDNDSEDSDEADNRKLQMLDGMSLMDVQQLLHPDYVKLRETQLFDPNAVPVVNPDAIQNHPTAFHGEDSDRQQRTEYDECQHDHAKLAYDKDIQSTTIDMWKEYEQWEKAAENQGFREMLARQMEMMASRHLRQCSIT